MPAQLFTYPHPVKISGANACFTIEKPDGSRMISVAKFTKPDEDSKKGFELVSQSATRHTLKMLDDAWCKVYFFDGEIFIATTNESTTLFTRLSLNSKETVVKAGCFQIERFAMTKKAICVSQPSRKGSNKVLISLEQGKWEQVEGISGVTKRIQAFSETTFVITTTRGIWFYYAHRQKLEHVNTTVWYKDATLSDCVIYDTEDGKKALVLYAVQKKKREEYSLKCFDIDKLFLEDWAFETCYDFPSEMEVYRIEVASAYSTGLADDFLVAKLWDGTDVKVVSFGLKELRVNKL